MATILIVDDLAAHRRFLVTLLGHSGHRLLEAANGRDGLATVRAERPDLVITDVLMPVMDGYEFVKQLRLDPATSRIPVLFYTAPYGASEARSFARSSSIPYILTKPGEPDEVLKIVGRVLSGESASEAGLGGTAGTTDVDRAHLRLLTDQLSEKADDLKDANARLRALINIGLDLAASHGSDRLLESVCEAACDLFAATYVTLGIVDRDDRTVRRFATFGIERPDWIAAGDVIVSGILDTAITERRTLRGDNPGGDPTNLQLAAGHPEVQAFLVAPIASRTHVYGWLCLVGNEGRPFTAQDEPMVMALASQVGRIYELEYEILERKQAESAVRHERESLRIAEERMRFALEATGVGIWDIDAVTGHVRWSDILESQYGLAPGTFDGTFEGFIAQMHPDDRAAVRQTFEKARKSGADFSVQHRALQPDGAVRWLSGAGRFQLDEHGAAVRAVGISQDVTERRALAEQSLQSQKMDAIGSLAGGVAHDFNNLLTVILGYCELLKVELGPDNPHQDDVAEIHRAGTSAASLTRQLLAFSRKQIIEPTRLDLNRVLLDMKAMLGRLIREDVKIVFSLQPAPAAVMADRAQIEQIVINLAVNARDAMPAGGTLTIETGEIVLDEQSTPAHRALRPGPHVALIVNDTGCGMTPEVRAHLFEPFFTTKEVGKGTGLGLASVHGIVTRSGGSVDVYSEAGCGSSFKILFPKADASETVVDAPLTIARTPRGGETILVVEDEAGLRELARRLLEQQGYTVLLAANANDALRIFEQNATIDMLLTDVVMPGTSGPELTQKLVGRYPDLKVIFMSGYTKTTIVHNSVLSPLVAFLQKPFTSETLGRKVREVLDRHSRARV